MKDRPLTPGEALFEFAHRSTSSLMVWDGTTPKDRQRMKRLGLVNASREEFAGGRFWFWNLTPRGEGVVSELLAGAGINDPEGTLQRSNQMDLLFRQRVNTVRS